MVKNTSNFPHVEIYEIRIKLHEYNCGICRQKDVIVKLLEFALIKFQVVHLDRAQ